MNPTQILVSQTTEDVLAESIAIDIQGRCNVSLFGGEVVPADRLSECLRSASERPDVVILIGRSDELRHYTSELLGQFPDLLVVGVAVGSDVVQFRVRQIGLSALIASACELSRLLSCSHSERADMTRMLTLSENPEAGFNLIDTPADGSLLGKALNWLDSILLRQLRRTSDCANDVPGLTISRSTVEGLLRSRLVADPESGQQADAAGRDFLRTLRTLDAGQDPLADLCRGLSLDWLEIRAFLLCLAPELDSKYQRVWGFLHDDLSRRHATVGALVAILADSTGANPGLGNIDRIFRLGLIDCHGNSRPHADEPLRVDCTLISWLTGNAEALTSDPLLAGLVRQEPWAGADVVDDDLVAPERERLEQCLASGEDVSWLVLTGPESSWWRALIEQAAERQTLTLLRISLPALQASVSSDADPRISRLCWVARLTNCVPVIDASATEAHSVTTAALKSLVDAVAEPGRIGIIVASDIAQVVDILPHGVYRLLHWDSSVASMPLAVFSRSAQNAGLHLAYNDCEQLAAAYPLSVEEICRSVRLAAARGASSTEPVRQAGMLAEACRQVACPELPRFATALEPLFQLDDVVLPVDRRQQLDEIVSHVRHAGTVLNTWGFGAQLPYGRGVTALFTGPSGTGKTMAAQAIGRAVQRQVYAVDLSRVVSKFIGETEKNLDAVFIEAERAGAVLLFDEADALFGKRSEVKDAHDRYANIETAYLLQRMEAFSGLAILTSNFGQNLDTAFLRRLRFSIEFPRPDAAARERIWRQCLPQEAPLVDDLDFHFLARRIDITGGNIRQITLRAAFSAAAEDVPIGLNHILKATHAEVVKLGMSGLARELTDFAA